MFFSEFPLFHNQKISHGGGTNSCPKGRGEKGFQEVQNPFQRD
ncbi:unnamed protein product [Staurois parvus]|uniref:Uncharacterized protein n=1 Tax=Staurois parvus TaxID=386267 RepID=A0ABN9C1Y2_9NEOB|nr:unnamed protein product [Staurois parvus]